MRVMKEINYLKFRQILSDPELYGDSILQLFAQKENCNELFSHHQAHEIYNTIYESFWDLYCKKP